MHEGSKISDKLHGLHENKDENVHRFVLSAIREELLERGRELVLGYYTRVTYYS